jgi:hypothetical protein
MASSFVTNQRSIFTEIFAKLRFKKRMFKKTHFSIKVKSVDVWNKKEASSFF